MGEWQGEKSGPEWEIRPLRCKIKDSCSAMGGGLPDGVVEAVVTVRWPSKYGCLNAGILLCPITLFQPIPPARIDDQTAKPMPVPPVARSTRSTPFSTNEGG